MKVDCHATIGFIVKSSGGVLVSGNPDMEINTITTDSRDLGKDNLFIPIVGERFDGHDFIEELARSRKIDGFLTMREEHAEIAGESGTSAILCDDTLKAYGRIASSYRDEMNPIVIGITGTNGKTTTKELLWSVLNRKNQSLKNEKNYNNEIGVPYTLLGLKKDHKWAVIEMGMNHTGEIDRLSKIAKPDMAVITNVGEGHLEFLGSTENVALAKSEIMNGMKEGSLIFLNRDTQCYDILFEKSSEMGLHVRSFGLSVNADISPEDYHVFKDGIEIRYRGEKFEVPAYGIHNVYNALSVIAVAYELGVEADIMNEAFSDFTNVDMRSQVLDRGYIIINDAYNSNPLSSKYALESLQEVFGDRRKIAMLSDMKELGSSSSFYHRELGKQVFEYGFDLLCTWGEMAEDIAEGAKLAGMKDDGVMHFNSREELIDFALQNLTEHDVVLVKGSRSMKMEEVVEALIH